MGTLKPAIKKCIKNNKFLLQTAEQKQNMADIFLGVLSNVKNGAVLEIGTHCGGSTMLWMDLIALSKADASIITVDPYFGTVELYPDKYVRTMATVSNKAMQLAAKTNRQPSSHVWCHYMVSDTLFMNEIYQTLPDSSKSYRFIFLDGPHGQDDIVTEMDFFQDKVLSGGVILIDDFMLLDEGIKKVLSREYAEDFEHGEFSNQVWFRRK